MFLVGVYLIPLCVLEQLSAHVRRVLISAANNRVNAFTESSQRAHRLASITAQQGHRVLV